MNSLGGHNKDLQAAVPPERSERDRLLRLARSYVRTHRLSPPMSLEQLDRHGRAVLRRAELDEKALPFVAVLLNNETWREVLAGIPYRRRLLLLPQCLRDAEQCSAPIDDYGLLCQHCGRCVLHELLTEAERLGYVTLVAEGTTVVTSLIESGKIEAVVGASCLSSLEPIFPFMEAAAFPGVAVPLLRDGCRNTCLDADWLLEAIYLTGADKTRRLDLDDLRGQVDCWFRAEGLAEVLGAADGQTERIGQQWLARSGKRWRPFLAVCAFQSLRADPSEPLHEAMRRVAVAVECFHKASLIHDDIEDGDAERYGQRTLHEQYGVPVALNVGDLLLGEGYRLLAECDAPAAAKAEMVRVAARAHRRLCLGQGAELCWRRAPGPLTPGEVIDIYAGKTAPAFEVALRLGAVLAGAGDDIGEVFREYAKGLGVAYQIRDDLDDFTAGEAPKAAGPSILLALAWQRAASGDKSILSAAWRGGPEAVGRDEIRDLLARLGAFTRASELAEQYKHRAVRCLQLLRDVSLKVLLRRVIAKIFFEIPSGDPSVGLTTQHAPGDEQGAGSAR